MEKKEDIKKEIKEEMVEDQDEIEEVLEEDAAIDGKEVEKDKGIEDEEKDGKDKEIEELTNRLLRLQADFINYKNRVEKEKETIFSHATEDIISQLLPVLDNFERALDSVEEKEGFYEGVKMIYDQILGILEKNGLKEIQCLGQSFDPNYHHAVLTEEVEDQEEGTILEVFQKGYMLNDKVIRPSMVKVAK
ncbi:MAG: nucleotide exchange factor GrpE [Tissierellia bacterium]|nr:nucleotide exchange factor GrpE [Tissierellia bacterium]